MSKKIFFIVLTCCLLVATFCVSFAGAPQVQSASADIRAVLDRPDCASAPLIVPSVVDPPLMDFVIPSGEYGSDLPYISESYEGDFSYIPSGTYQLGALLSSSSSFDVELSMVDDGSFALLSFFSAEGDLVSSVSLFSLLNTQYSSLNFVVDGGSFTLYLNPFDGGESIIVTGTSLVLTLQANRAFSVFSENLQSFYFDSLSVDSSPILLSVMDTLFSGLRAIGTNVGRAFSTIANAIFINAEGTGISTFGILVVVFSAVSLGLSLTRWVLNFCSSWGKRNR